MQDSEVDSLIALNTEHDKSDFTGGMEVASPIIERVARGVEEMIRSGAKKYDFLGGDDPYKAKFGAHQ